jgi:hypothetical protein
MEQARKNKEFVIRHFEAINRQDVQTVVGNMLPALYDHELNGDHKHDIVEGAKRLQALMQRIPQKLIPGRSLSSTVSYSGASSMESSPSAGRRLHL